MQRWLRASGVVETADSSQSVRLTQQGEFRLGADKPWMPMHATEYYTTNPPGFLWNASMEMFPLVHVTGRDRYFQGTGDIEMRIASLIPVASKSGGNLEQRRAAPLSQRNHVVSGCAGAPQCRVGADRRHRMPAPS